MLLRYVFPLLLVALCPTMLLAGGQFDDLVKQLDSDKFSERQSASTKLEEAGADAIPTLEQAAQSTSLETSVRALEVQQKHFKGDNKELQAAAKKALEGVAASDNKNAATRATRALAPEKVQPAPGNNGIAFPGIRGNIRIQMGNGRNIQIQQAGGVKHIQVNENGKKIKIKQDAQGIEMQITETKNGKETTENFKAKNEADLKKQHPAAHKIFEKHANNQNRIQIRAIGLQPGQFPRLPGNAIMPKILPPGAAAKMAKKLKEADEQIAKALKQFEELTQETKDDKTRQTLEQLETARKNLQEVKKQLDN